MTILRSRFRPDCLGSKGMIGWILFRMAYRRAIAAVDWLAAISTSREKSVALTRADKVRAQNSRLIGGEQSMSAFVRIPDRTSRHARNVPVTEQPSNLTAAMTLQRRTPSALTPTTKTCRFSYRC